MSTRSILSFLSKDNPFGENRTLALNENGKLIVVEKSKGFTSKVSRFFRTHTRKGKIEEAARIRNTLQKLQSKVDSEIKTKTHDLWGFQSNGLKVENVIKNVKKITKELQKEAAALDTDKKVGILTFDDAPQQTHASNNTLEGLIEDINGRSTNLSAIEGKMRQRTTLERITLSDKPYSELSREERVEIKIRKIEKKLSEIESKLRFSTNPELKQEQKVLKYAMMQLRLRTPTFRSTLTAIERKLNSNMGTSFALPGAPNPAGNKTLFQRKSNYAKIKDLKMLINVATDKAQKNLIQDLLVVLEAAQLIEKVDHPESTGFLKMIGMAPRTIGDELASIRTELDSIEKDLPRASSEKRKSLLERQEVLQLVELHLSSDSTPALEGYITDLVSLLNDDMGANKGLFNNIFPAENKNLFKNNLNNKTFTIKIDLLKQLLNNPNISTPQKKIMEDLLIALQAAQHIKKVSHPETTGFMKMIGRGAHSIGDELVSIQRDLDQIEKALPSADIATKKSLTAEQRALRYAESQLISGSTEYLHAIDATLNVIYNGDFMNEPFSREKFEKLTRKEQIQKLAMVLEYDNKHIYSGGQQPFVNPRDTDATKRFLELNRLIRAAERIERVDEIKKSSAVAAQINHQFKPAQRSMANRAASGIGGYFASAPRLLGYGAYFAWMFYGSQIGGMAGQAAGMLPEDWEAAGAACATALQIAAPILVGEGFNYGTKALGWAKKKLFGDDTDELAALRKQIMI